jgi:hypothetical protein
MYANIHIYIYLHICIYMYIYVYIYITSGEIAEYNAPVGFAKNPCKEYHSLNNEG